MRRWIAAFMMTMGGSVAAAQDCSPEILNIRGEWGSARFRVEIADTPEARNQGLMFRESLPTLSGMLFVYDHPQHASFWMKNTLIPLDMVFIDETGVVTHIHENAVPHDLRAIPSNSEILVVLEINGGLSSTFGISTGSEVMHPSIPQEDAIWPCE